MVACPLCQAEARLLTETLRRGTGSVWHCPHCDLGFLVAAPRDDLAYYKGAYREHVSHRAEEAATSPQELFDVYRRYQSARVERVLRNFAPGASVLEIGASAGQFISYLKHITKTRCAVELDPACCAFMRTMGIDADDKVLSESKFADERFDVVAAFQVLEHVEQPVMFLDEMRRALKPGGTAYCEIPNLNDALLSVWKNEGYARFYYHEDHRWYMTKKSARKMAELAGFTSIKIDFVTDYNLVSTLGWLANGHPQSDCRGLGETRVEGKNAEISTWLSAQLAALGEQYTEKIVALGASSNLMLTMKA